MRNRDSHNAQVEVSFAGGPRPVRYFEMSGFKTGRSRVAILALVSLVAGLLTGCQSAKMGGAGGTGDAAKQGNQRWRSSYADAREEHRSRPGWNQSPQVATGSLQGARPSYSSVQISEPYLALTYDDGPHPANTPRLLDILKARNVRATFFVVGPNAKAYPQIVRRMIAEGHEVANHTWTHSDLTKLSTEKVRWEMTSTKDAIVAACGVAPKVYRPPYGATNSGLRTLIRSEFGYPTIMWSVDPLDWKRPGATVVANRLVAGARNGGILLLHDIHKPTIDATPMAVDRLMAKGFKFVTVSELITLERKAGVADASERVEPTLMPVEPETTAVIAEVR